MRVNNRGEAWFNSFEEVAASMNIKPVTRVTSNAEKLKGQREGFVKRHKCRACGEPMSWIGGNMMTCTNEKCKGIKVVKEDEEGNKKVTYLTSYDLLDDTGAEIASRIFD